VKSIDAEWNRRRRAREALGVVSGDGVILYLNAAREFGRIRTATGAIFFWADSCTGTPLRVGQRVSFVVRQDGRGRLQARSVRPVQEVTA